MAIYDINKFVLHFPATFIETKVSVPTIEVAIITNGSNYKFKLV